MRKQELIDIMAEASLELSGILDVTKQPEYNRAEDLATIAAIYSYLLTVMEDRGLFDEELKQ